MSCLRSPGQKLVCRFRRSRPRRPVGGAGSGSGAEVWGAPQVRVPTHSGGRWASGGRSPKSLKGGGGSGKWKHGQVGVTKRGICTLPFQKRGQPAACGPRRIFASGEYQECESLRCCVIPSQDSRQQFPINGGCVVDLRFDGLIPASWDRLKEDPTGRRERPRSGTFLVKAPKPAGRRLIPLDRFSSRVIET